MLALLALRAQAPQSNNVCPDRTDHRRRWWDEVRNDAGTVGFHWHDLRHTFASRLVMAGCEQTLPPRNPAGHDALCAPRRKPIARSGREARRCTRGVTARGEPNRDNPLSGLVCWCRRRESNPHALAGNGF